MFALHTPQTVTLASPDPDYDGPPTTINFRTNGADTSRCVMEVITPDGDMYRLTFDTRGAMVDQQFVAHDAPPDAPHLSDASFMVDGRDTRADNAYTYKAPVDADTAYRDGTTAGFSTPESDEHREHRLEVYAEANDARREQVAAAEERVREIQKQSGAHVEEPGNTPEHDPIRPPRTEYVPPAPRVTDEDWPKTGEEMVPAPSTALPGGEPPHPLGEPSYTERSNVNTTRNLDNPPTGKPPAGVRPTGFAG